MFRNNLLVTSSSVNNYQHTLSNNTEERRPYLHRGGKLKSLVYEFDSNEEKNPIKMDLNYDKKGNLRRI
jgi:hypothetical protein